MAFGFDPSIILSGLPRPPPESSFNDTVQTLASLASQRTQQQQGQAQLADLLRKQGDEKRLSDIIRASAASMPAGMARNLASEGFGRESMAWADQDAQMAQKKSEDAKRRLELQTAYQRHIGEKAANVKDQASLDAFRQELAMSGDPFLAMYAQTKVPETYTPEAIKPIADQAISPEKRATLDAIANRANTRVVTDDNGNVTVFDANHPDQPAKQVPAPGGGPPLKARQPGKGGGGGGGTGTGGSPKEWKELTNAINTGARGSLNKDLQKSINSAEALETLLRLPDGSFTQATPQQMHEAYTALNNLISKGGSQAASQIEALVPETLASKWANLKQKVLNEPQSADAHAFIENILDTTKREANLARKQLRRQQLQYIPNYAHLRQANPARFESILKGVGIDPTGIDEKGLEVAAPPAGGGGLSKAEAEELRKLEGKYGGKK